MSTPEFRGPSKELIESTHEFPTAYPFKVIGRGEEFVGNCVSRAEGLLGREVPVRVRTSENGRHQSVTLEPVVHSADEILSMYQELSVIEGLVLLL